MTANRELAEKQKLTDEEIIAVDVLHDKLYSFLSNPTTSAEEKDCSKIVEAFEYTLQALWKFPFDSKYHRYQFDLAGCCCPFFDNLERIGITNLRIYSTKCPYHGNKA